MRRRTPEEIARSAEQRAAVDLGVQVKFEEDRYWWTVQALTENFAALTRDRPFHPDEKVYTVIDWTSGVRGPCDLLGQGYGEGVYDQDECAEMLQEFEQHLVQEDLFQKRLAVGDSGPWPHVPTLQVSHRNRVAISIKQVKR